MTTASKDFCLSKRTYDKIHSGLVLTTHVAVASPIGVWKWTYPVFFL
jgi:hypothetical protein